MDAEYDVAIVGAGPAGLECARVLGEAGRSVLLLERKEVVGPKKCAGGLSSLCDITPPPGRARYFSEESVYLGDRRHDVRLAGPLVMVDRLELGQLQLRALDGAKTLTILKGTSVRKIEKNRLVTSRGSFGFRKLVGADGASSLVRRHLNLPSKYCLGVYYNVPEITNELILFLHPRLKSGYIWEFPHLDCTNIGIYYRPEQIETAVAKRELEDYLTRKGYEYAADEYHAAPVNYLYRGCVFGDTFLAGEAAGLALKNSGEGIPYALASGREVARKILDPGYPMPELKKFLKIKRREESRLRMFDVLPFLRGPLLKMYLGMRKLS
jgi:geranylgeranyl reductase